MSRRTVAMKKNQLIARRRIVLFTIISIITILFIAVFLSSFTANASESEVTNKYYTSICLQDGDSLWSIADEYMTSEYRNQNEYINEVKQLNHLSSDTIHEGQHLMIPYYAIDR